MYPLFSKCYNKSRYLCNLYIKEKAHKPLKGQAQWRGRKHQETGHGHAIESVYDKNIFYFLFFMTWNKIHNMV